MSEENKEARRQRREKECTGAGFTNSEWLVAIDNAGETLALHSAGSVQRIQPPLPTDDSDSDEHDTNAISRRMRVVSELHCYTGPKFTSHTRLQIGHLCPAEVLDLELDTIAFPPGDYQSIAESNAQWDSGTELSRQAQVRGKPPTNASQQFKPAQQPHARKESAVS